MTLAQDYKTRLDLVLEPLALGIQGALANYLSAEPRVDRVTARAKSIDRFIDKAAKKKDDGTPKYPEPLHQIQDQVGARIVTFYLDDVDRISRVVENYFRPVEAKYLIPESDSEFGYFGKHYVLLVPTDAVSDEWDKSLVPEFFELQIKTMFQHAWAEANHDLGYKPGVRQLTSDEFRQLAFTAAQSWGADRIFNDLFQAQS